MKLKNKDFIQVKDEIKSIIFKTIVVSLIYAIMATSLNLIFSINFVSQYIFKVGSLHQIKIKKIIKYLIDIKDFKLYLNDNKIDLWVFYNVDWVKDANDKSSNTKDIFFIKMKAIL